MSTFENRKSARGNGKPKDKEPVDNGPINIKAKRILLATCMAHNKELEALAACRTDLCGFLRQNRRRRLSVMGRSDERAPSGGL